MAKNTFLDWSTTASNNTDIGGTGILGTNAVSNFDDAFRTLMAQLRSGVDGKVVYAVKVANYTALLNDNNAVHRYTATATVSLTAAATLGTGWHYTVIADGADVTIDPSGAETIDGAATLVIPNGQSEVIICNGTAFFTEKLSSLNLKLQPFATIASAATTDLSTVASQNVTVTGTTTITSFGTAGAGTFRRLRFSGILTLTHNATSLILPGAANITTAAGDTLEAVSLGSGNWVVTSYQPSGQAPYITGTFTPTYTAGGASTGVTYSTQTGTYTKIGRLVFFTLRVTLSNAGSAAGAVAYAALPFAAASRDFSVSVSFYNSFSGLTGAPVGFIASGASSISMRQTGAATVANITQANITNTADIIISGSYEVA